MPGRARVGWREKVTCRPNSRIARWLATRSPRAAGPTLPCKSAACHKPRSSQVPVPLKWVPQKSEGLVEGFCPEPVQEEQIAVNANGLMIFLRLGDVEWLEAVDDCVALHFGKQTHLVRGTLSAVAAKLPSDRFFRISPSMLVNAKRVREFQPMFHGRCGVLLHSGARLTVMRSYLLARDGEPDRAPRRPRREGPA